jgi:integrase
MSSLTYYNSTRTGWQLQAYSPRSAGKRHSIWLGELPEREARKIKLQIDALCESLKLGTPIPGETLRWLESLSPQLRVKLAPLLGAAKTVDDAATEFLDWSGSQRAASTTTAKQSIIRLLVRQFGHRQLRSLSPAEVDAWLDGLNVAASTLATRANQLTSFFSWCRKQGWLEEFRLATAKTICVGKKDFLGNDMLQLWIDQFRDDPQMHCALAFARWYGARIPSELLTLTRGSIDWEQSRVTIVDRKRSKRTSRGPPLDVVRIAPLFPEWVPYVERVWRLSTHPSDPLLPGIDSGGAFVERCRRAREAAGLEEWPRLFTSVRATRETELITRFGLTAACAWIGNSAATAQRNYAQVPDDVWKEASGCASLT